MRKLVLIAVASCMCGALSGCWFFDAAHNRRHYEVVKEDIRLIHQDLDFIMMLDRKSPNDAYYR